MARCQRLRTIATSPLDQARDRLRHGLKSRLTSSLHRRGAPLDDLRPKSEGGGCLSVLAARWWWPWRPCTASPKRCEKQSNEQPTRGGGRVIRPLVFPRAQVVLCVYQRQPMELDVALVVNSLRATRLRGERSAAAEGMWDAAAIDFRRGHQTPTRATDFVRCARGLRQGFGLAPGVYARGLRRGLVRNQTSFPKGNNKK
eukprot:scaffold96375_cov65-Phaeocystis_antarctica.AAC.2